MIEDPIVDEVHRVRETMLNQFDGDLQALVEHLRDREARAGRVVLSAPSQPRRPLPADPIVEEVRRAREAYAATFGGNLHALCEDLRRRTRERAEAGHPAVSLPARPVGTKSV